MACKSRRLTEQVWEALRALYLVGSQEDLAGVENLPRALPGMSERVRQQAATTAEAIRRRAANPRP